MLNADILKELAKDCNAERLAEKKGTECCAGCPLGTICPVFVKSLRDKEDTRKFVKETNFCYACKDCPSRFKAKERCCEGDPWYKCPKYLKHEEREKVLGPGG